MARIIIVVACVLGFLAVALGAFGAHGLESVFAAADDPAKRRAWWSTATEYHMWHALLLLGVGVLGDRVRSRAIVIAFVAIGLGTLLFSGSLYVMAVTGIRWLGAITPLGGVAFLSAWIAAAVAVRKL